MVLSVVREITNGIWKTYQYAHVSIIKISRESKFRAFPVFYISFQFVKLNIRHFLIITDPGCSESTMKKLQNGESKRMMRGAVYKFRCDPGSVMDGPPTVYCNGNDWNDTKPECLSK